MLEGILFGQGSILFGAHLVNIFRPEEGIPISPTRNDGHTVETDGLTSPSLITVAN